MEETRMKFMAIVERNNKTMADIAETNEAIGTLMLEVCPAEEPEA